MIAHHPVRYQFDLLHTCIYKPGKDRGNAFIHRNGDTGILSLRVRDCASLRNQQSGRRNDKNSRREVFKKRVFSKKKKKKKRKNHRLFFACK